MIKQTIKIHLCPNSSRNAICGKYNEEYIKIAIKEKPIDGKANEALIKFLSKELSIITENLINPPMRSFPEERPLKFI